MFRDSRLLVSKKRSQSIVILCSIFLLLMFMYHKLARNIIMSKAITHLAPTSADQRLFGNRDLIIWNNDHHSSAAIDASRLLKPLGVNVLVNVLSDYCEYFNVCDARRTLKVINKGNIFSINSTLVSEFYEAYQDDPVMKTVDAFLCYDPPSVCELFEPFNRSLIFVFTARFYHNRRDLRSRALWQYKLWNMAKNPRNVIAANNVYDAEVIQYYTGIKPVLLPNYCDYTNTTYDVTRPGYLLAKRRQGKNFNNWFKSQYDSLTTNRTSAQAQELIAVEQRYPFYNFTDLAAHRGIVHLPYQVSIMSLFEQYRMNIPLFFPSQQLLLRWILEHNVVVDRVLTGFSYVSHPSQRHLPNPVDNRDPKAVAYWLKFADFYTLPHIVYFDSVEHLVDLLESLTTKDLLAISDKMKQYNSELKEDLIRKWTGILQNVAKYRAVFL